MSVYISSLPVYTGTAADLRWFIMNNSGETTTFKYSGYTSPYKIVGTNNSNNIYDTASMVGTFSSIVGGEVNQIQGGTHNFIGGGYNNILNSNTRNNYAIVGGANNVADGESGFGLTTGEYNNTQGRWGFVAGRSNTINANNAQFCLGWGNTMTGDNSDVLGIFSSYNNTLDVSSTQAATIIGSSNSQLRTRGVFGQHNGSTIFGSNTSFIKESSATNNKYSGSRVGIVLSIDCGIYNSNSSNYLDHNLILSSSASTIYDSSQSQIIGGINNTISGKTDVVMIGCSGRTATEDNTTYTENIKGFGYKYNFGGNNTVGGTDTYHFVVGKNNTLSNTASILNTGAFIFGENNSVTGGRMNGAFGYNNSVSGWDAWAFGDNHSVGGYYSVAFGNNTNVASNQSFGFGYGAYVGAEASFSFGENNDITAGESQVILGGKNSTISSSGKNNTILGGSGNTISSGSNVVMLGTSNRTNTTTDATFVENLVVFNYAALDFADDTAAAAGGVVLGQIYHNGGLMRIRIV
jgi:hypothetical protein